MKIKQGEVMECVFQIGEISKFFDIPASTLRFWEESGILIPKKIPRISIGYTQYQI